MTWLKSETLATPTMSKMKSLKGILNLGSSNRPNDTSVVSSMPSLPDEPQQRYAHGVITYKDRIGILGGIVNGKFHYTLSFMDIYSIASCSWSVVALSGDPPASASRMSYTQYEKYYLQMGGHCGNESCICETLSNKVFQMDLDSYVWKEICTSKSPIAPIPKRGCGMVVLGNTLIVIGGYGNISKGQSAVSHYTSHRTANTGWTNEIHSLQLDSESSWAIPEVVGDRPLPCQNFTITKITDDSAILFGGYSVYGCLSDTYLVQYDKNKLINVPPEIAKRKSFTLSAFYLTPYLVRLVAFGGVAEWSREKHSNQQCCLSSTMQLDISNLCDGMNKLTITPKQPDDEESFTCKLIEAHEKMQKLYFQCKKNLEALHSDYETAVASYSDSQNKLDKELHSCRNEIEALKGELHNQLRKCKSLEDCNQKMVSMQQVKDNFVQEQECKIMALVTEKRETAAQVKILDEIKSEMIMKLEQKDVVINTLEETLSVFQIQAQHSRIDHIKEINTMKELLKEEQHKRMEAENNLQEIAIAFRVGNELLVEEQRKKSDLEVQLQEVQTTWSTDQQLLADEVAARQKYQMLCNEQERSIKLLQRKCDELSGCRIAPIISRDGTSNNQGS